MRHEDFRDPGMDRGADPTAAWERSLRPATSSIGIWLLIGIAVTAGLLYALISLWSVANPQRSANAPPTATPLPPTVRTPPARPESPAFPGAGSAQRTQRFSKCTAASGAIAYSDGPCPEGSRTSEVAVNPDLNLADGMSDEERRASMQENRAVARSVVAHERRVAMAVDHAVVECAQLKALIESIDAAARQPQPPAEQDRLKDERRRAHDRRFALRCG